VFSFGLFVCWLVGLSVGLLSKLRMNSYDIFGSVKALGQRNNVVSDLRPAVRKII